MGMIASGIGGFIKTFGDVQAHSANMQIAQQNEKIAQAKAANDVIIGQNRMSTKLQEGGHRAAHVEAAAAAGGVDVRASGSVDRVKEGVKVMNARDILAIKGNAENQVFGHLMQARDFDITAQQERMATTLAPLMNAAGAAGGAFKEGSAIDRESATTTKADFTVGGGGNDGPLGYAAPIGTGEAGTDGWGY